MSILNYKRKYVYTTVVRGYAVCGAVSNKWSVLQLTLALEEKAVSETDRTCIETVL